MAGAPAECFPGEHENLCFRGMQTRLILEAYLIFQLYDVCASKKKTILLASAHGFMLNFRMVNTNARGANKNLVHFACTVNTI